MFNGRPILVRFIWTRGPTPRWEQAFSEDGGNTWEPNWIMDYTRIPDDEADPAPGVRGGDAVSSQLGA